MQILSHMKPVLTSGTNLECPRGGKGKQRREGFLKLLFILFYLKYLGWEGAKEVKNDEVCIGKIKKGNKSYVSYLLMKPSSSYGSLFVLQSLASAFM